MGKKWDYDVPSIELWHEVFRVLKPGAHLLSFGGTRTYHRMVVNIEDAGFEIRDQLQWLYGSGFPKSHNISKGIDKKYGVERELIGRYLPPQDDPKNKWTSKNKQYDKNHPEGGTEIFGGNKDRRDITAPSTSQAKQWDGWGTALKPSNEPIVLARKPLSEKTVVDNVLKWGCGGLNIDGSRIEGKPRTTHAAGNVVTCEAESGHMKGKKPHGPQPGPQGRWPANTLFDYAASQMLDEQSGVLKSGDVNPYKNKGGWKNTSTFKTGTFKASQGGASRFFKCFSYGNEDDISSEWKNPKHSKTVKPADRSLNLDDQLLNSVHEAVKTNFKKDRQLLQCLDSMPDYKRCILYQSLASLVEAPENIGTIEIIQSLLRLFGSVHLAIDESIKQVSQRKGSVPSRFLYQAKASKRERNEGLEGMPEKQRPGLFDDDNYEWPDPNGHKIAKPQQNHHPTVKPIKLMQYLVRLITPPNGIVLDPFMGSGTTGIAALNSGFEFCGIELNKEYLEIARKRISKRR